MAKGRKTGGRKRGTPNKVGADDRAAFRMVYERRLSDLDRWLGETGDGYETVLRNKLGAVVMDEKGEPVKVKVGKDPGKAALILASMAEFFIPKLSRIEVPVVPEKPEDATPATPEEIAELERLAVQEIH